MNKGWSASLVRPSLPLPSQSVTDNAQCILSVTPSHRPLADFLPRQHVGTTKPLLPWLIRRVEVIRGHIPLCMQCAPAFNYARDEHRTSIVDDASTLGSQKKVLFESPRLSLDLRYVTESTMVRVSAFINANAQYRTWLRRLRNPDH